MDHLVLHQFGAAIVESKSVTTSVRINAADEWERFWDGRWKGMPDPLLQGQRQGLLLRRLLASRDADLLDTIAFGMIQGTFTHMALDVFAAISDEGVIERAQPKQAANALKADAVPRAILDTIVRHRKATSLLNFNPKSSRGPLGTSRTPRCCASLTSCVSSTWRVRGQPSRLRRRRRSRSCARTERPSSRSRARRAAASIWSRSSAGMGPTAAVVRAAATPRSGGTAGTARRACATSAWTAASRVPAHPASGRAPFT